MNATHLLCTKCRSVHRMASAAPVLTLPRSGEALHKWHVASVQMIHFWFDPLGVVFKPPFFHFSFLFFLCCLGQVSPFSFGQDCPLTAGLTPASSESAWRKGGGLPHHSPIIPFSSHSLDLSSRGFSADATPATTANLIEL